MNSTQLLRNHHRIEVLESRIAPAAVTLSFFDQDNKAVSVMSSKGTIADLQAAVGVAPGATATGVLSLQLGPVFKGADITVTAGVDATDAITTRIGAVNAAGIDLGKLTIDGELDRILAGDTNSGTPALKSLSVGTWGNGTLPTTPGQFDSFVIGSIPTLTVKGDFNGAYLEVRGSDSGQPMLPAPLVPQLTDPQGKIGTLFIGGSLLGTARKDGGHIFTTGDITSITVVGSVLGFRSPTPIQLPPLDQDYNARIFSYGKITTLLVGTDAVAGDVVGGDGRFSGQIVGVDGIASVTVKGNIRGGIGEESGAIGAAENLGAIVITKSLIGGDGARSGSLLSFSGIQSVKIGGNIEGGNGFNSGAIGVGVRDTVNSGVVIGNVVVTGDIIGGSGYSSGQIVSQGTIKNVTVRNLIGGSNFETGAIGSLKGLGAILIKGDIIAGTGTRSGFISTEPEPIERIGEGGPSGANAPIASVTVEGSIYGDPLETIEEGGEEGGYDVLTGGYRAGGILSSGQLGAVVVLGDVVGGYGYETGRIASSRGITSVKIGGKLAGCDGAYSGTIFAGTTIGAAAIGDPQFQGDSEGGGFTGRGIIGDEGIGSGSVVAAQITKIDVFGDLLGGAMFESGVIKTTGVGAAGKMGPVYVRGTVAGSLGERSGAIISSGAITSVKIGTATIDESDLIGGRGKESGSIISQLDLGPVYIEGSIIGGGGEDSGSFLSAAKIASVYVGAEVRGGIGIGSGKIESSGNLGPVSIGSDPNGLSGGIIGGNGAGSGAVLSGGKLAKIDIFGNVLGGDGPASGRIATQGPLGDMGPVFISRSLIGSFGSANAAESGQIFSSGKLASVIIGDPTDTDTETGSVIGGIARGSGSITSALDMGPVKIRKNLQGGTGNESGKITSGGKLTSLTIGQEAAEGSIIGGSGNYDTTVESGNQYGQVFAAGTIGPVIVFGDVQGNTSDSVGGAYSAQVRGLAIASVTVHGDVNGGRGAHSGGFYATSLNIGPVNIGGDVEGGAGTASGFISAEGNLPSVKIGGSLRGGFGSGSGYVAAGGTLGALTAAFASGDSETSRPRISAGKLISAVTINESIFNTDILAGYNTSGFEFNPDAQIGTVKIGAGTGPGNMQGTNIVAGLGAGKDGYFGTYDDHLILGTDNPTIFSKIAKVIVKGSISDTSNEIDTFGIVAQNLVSLMIGSSTLALTAGALNDDYRSIGESDTVYGERIID